MPSTKRKLALAASFLALTLTTGAAAPAPETPGSKQPVITVYKDPDCGCCNNWIEHLVKHGFKVESKDTREMTEVKANLGVPGSLESCHTGVVGGYLVEGHVPAADILRMLRQKPRVAGLAVPGMPMGSPGMEGPRKQKYDVVSFDKKGKTKVFARH